MELFKKTQKAPQELKPLGIYVHVPFCRSKCEYCDFYSLGGGLNQESMDLYEEAALEEMQYAVDFLGYSSSAEYSVGRIDSSVISVKGFHYAYTGGAHGNYGSVGATFDAKTGAELSFWDLAEDKQTFAEATLNSCLTQVSAEYSEGLYSDYEEIIRSVWAEEPNWYLEAAGITVIFAPYEIGPYAMGEVYVTLPYQELADVMKSEYSWASE